MSSYINQVIRRTKPMTRCQCAVLGVLTSNWSTPDQVWKRNPIYADNRQGRIKKVGYGTVSAILRGLVQQGFAETEGRHRKKYRSIGS